MIGRAWTRHVRKNISMKYWLSEKKKDSKWIYSNKAEQMSDTHKGRIYVCTDVGDDTHNCTLRMHKALNESSLIMAYDRVKVTKFMKALTEKVKFVKDELNQQDALIPFEEDNQIVSFSPSKQKQVEYEMQIQLSKQLQMAIEDQVIMKSNNDRQNVILKQHQQELIKFMKVNMQKEQLDEIKGRQGHPKVVSIKDHLLQLEQLHINGVDTVCFLDEMHIAITEETIRYLQTRKLPYEIFPSTNTLINLTATAGFPADRFAIQYFPQSVQEMLSRRKTLKMTVSLIIEHQRAFAAVQDIVRIYGKQHIIFIENSKQTGAYRGFAADAKGYLQTAILDTKYCKIAIAPYISTFNEELKEARTHKSRIFGEAMAENTHLLRLQLLADELKTLQQKQSTFEVNLQHLIIEIYKMTKDDNTVLSIVKQLINIPETQLQQILNEAKAKLVTDCIGLSQMVKGKGY